MSNIRWLFMAGALLCFSGPLFAVQELDPGFFSDLETSTYRFSEHLATDAETFLIKPKVYSKNGVWAEDHFFFPGAGDDANVILARSTLGLKPIEIIQFQAYADFSRTFRFTQVPPAARLVVFFIVSKDNNLSGSKSKTIYLRVFVGKKLITRLRISSEDGYVQKSFPLQGVRFLKQNLKVTFDAVADDEAAVVSMFGYTAG